jgi:hypothetical protein
MCLIKPSLGVGRGVLSSRLYLTLKWGCDEDQKNCVYAHPFNNPDFPISYWRLDQQRCVSMHGATAC